MTGETAVSLEDPPRVLTYAFLDLETTDLMINRPRITELSIVAVHAEDMLAAGVLPRVTNRLTLCFNPRKLISPGSSLITGLYNDNLELQSTFSVATTTLLNNFFDHLAQPVCLVAHFGNGFDYPLLAAELKRINQSLTPSLMCVDSLEVFRVLDGLPPRHDSANQNRAIAPSPSHQAQVSISSPATPPNYRSALEAPCAPQKRKFVNEDSTSPKLLKNDIETCSIGLHSETIKIQQNTTTGKVRKRLFNGEDTAEIKEASEKLKETEADIEFTSSLEDDDFLALADEVEKEFGLKDAIRSVSEKTEKNKNESEELCDVPEATIGLTHHSTESFPGSEPSIAKCLDPPNCESQTFDQTNTCSRTDTAHYTQQGKRKHGGDVNAGTGYLVRNANSDGKSVSNTEHKSNSKADNNQPTLMNVKEISNTKEDNTPQAEVLANNQADSSGTRDGPLLNVNPTPGYRQNGANHGTPSSQKSFKLKDIHQRIFGCLPLNSHRAEDDCITLLKVAKCTPGFTDCVASRILPFSTIQPPGWARSRPSP